MTVFCCCTTSTVSIKVMDSYNSSAFIQAITRMSMLLSQKRGQLCIICAYSVKTPQLRKCDTTKLVTQRLQSLPLDRFSRPCPCSLESISQLSPKHTAEACRTPAPFYICQFWQPVMPFQASRFTSVDTSIKDLSRQRVTRGRYKVPAL